MITLMIVGVVCLAVGFVVGCVYDSQRPEDSRAYYQYDSFEDDQDE